MRVLFTFVGGSGHLRPLLPIARALRARGHVTAVAGCPAMVAEITNEGFTAFAAGPDMVSRGTRRPLLEPDPEREDRDLREGFARRAAAGRARDISTLSADWRPDLVVCDELDFGSMIAAERLAIPYATVLVIAAGSFVRREVVSGPLHELRAAYGLPFDRDLSMLSRHLVLSPFPLSFRDPAFPLPRTAHAFRPFAAFPRDRGATFRENNRGNSAPEVYVTLGTIFNLESGDLFDRILAGLRDLPIHAVVTVGQHIDPEQFGPQPANVRIERFIPQSEVLCRCDAVISHAGSGSVMGALAYGLPMVLLPMGADQPHNAARCEALGLGVALHPVTATPPEIQTALTAILRDPRYRDRAGVVGEEIAALPGPESPADLLEELGNRST